MFTKHSEVFGWKLLCKCKIIISSQPPVPWPLAWAFVVPEWELFMGCSAGSLGCIGQYIRICRLFFFLWEKHSNSVGCLAGFHHLNVSLLISAESWDLQEQIVNRLHWKRGREKGHLEEMAPPIKKNQAISPCQAKSERITQGSLSPLPRRILCMFIHRKEKRIVDLLSVPKFHFLPSPERLRNHGNKHTPPRGCFPSCLRCLTVHLPGIPWGEWNEEVVTRKDVCKWNALSLKDRMGLECHSSSSGAMNNDLRHHFPFL